MGCFGSKTEASAVVAVKPPTATDKHMGLTNTEDHWNISAAN